MNDIASNYPIPAVVAVVFQGAKVLLIRRGQEPNKGRWGFPGGKIEFGESITEAAIRELAEETTIKAKADKILTAFDVCSRDSDDAIQYHYILIPVCCTYLEGQASAASDAADAAWFTIDALDESDPDLIKNVVQIAKKAHDELTISSST